MDPLKFIPLDEPTTPPFVIPISEEVAETLRRLAPTEHWTILAIVDTEGRIFFNPDKISRPQRQ